MLESKRIANNVELNIVNAEYSRYIIRLKRILGLLLPKFRDIISGIYGLAYHLLTDKNNVGCRSQIDNYFNNN